MKSQRPLFFQCLTAPLFLGLGLLFNSCMSDGPNQVGSEYLAQQGVILKEAVQEVTFESFPLEGFQSSLAEPPHLAERIGMLGSWNGVRGSMRFAFSLSNKAMLDSLDSAKEDSSIQVRLALAFPKWGGFKTDSLPQPGQAYLESQVKGMDSLKVLVTSLILIDPTETKFNALVTEYKRAFIDKNYSLNWVQSQNDSLLQAPGSMVLDTVTLSVASIYDLKSADSIQALALPNLRGMLIGTRYPYRLIMTQIEPLDATSANGHSQDLMLRPACSILATSNGPFYAPALVFGKTVNPAYADPKTQRLEPYSNGGQLLPAVNYQTVEVAEDNGALMVGPNRTVTFRINRQTLLDSLAHRLPGLAGATKGAFDSRFFIPYAEISVPLDTVQTQIENDYSLDIKATSYLDSVAGSELPGTFEINNIKLKPEALPKSQWGVLWVLDPNTTFSQKQDTIKMVYQKATKDTALRYLRLCHTADTTVDLDTLILMPGVGKDFEYTTIAGSRYHFAFRIEARSNDFDIAFKMRPYTQPESPNYRDPVTGNFIVDSTKLTSRFLSRSQGEVTIRATKGIQSLINRASIGRDVLHAFSIQSNSSFGLDSSTGYKRTSFPILGKVQFLREAGSVHARVHILLFPISQP